MLKPITLTTTILALTVAAGAHMASASSTEDIYREATWDIHAAATPDAIDTGKFASPALYREAAWDDNGIVDASGLARRLAEAQEASKPSSGSARLYNIE